MRVAFQIGYLAEGFYGYAPQPGKCTVAGTLEEGLRSRKALAPHSPLRVASRTDRGVSAIGNVLSIETPLAGPTVGRMLNTLDARIFCFGYAEVPRAFDPRFAVSRTYRYFLPGAGHDAALLGRTARLFRGEHDFASFSRRDHPPRDTIRTLTRCEVRSQGPFLLLELEAPSFLWGQVRKIVAALLLREKGKLTEEALTRALEGRPSLTLPLAPPENLVLMEVAYDFAFTPLGDIAVRRLGALAERLAEVELRAKLLGLFREAVIDGPPRLSADTG